MSNVIIYDTYNVNVTIQNDEVVGVQVVAGFIHDVIAGTNISIDKTDPLNPVISSTVSGGGTWGSITGTLSNQTDLQTALNAKLSSLSNGNGTTANGSAVDIGGTLTADANIDGAYSVGFGQTTALAAFNVNADSGFLFTTGANTWGYSGGLLLMESDNSNKLKYQTWNLIHGITDGLSAEGFQIDDNGAIKLRIPRSGSNWQLNLGSDATGDTYYRNSSGYFTRLAAGTNGHVLTLAGGIPSWAAPSGGSGLTVGTSTITSGTNTRVLYNNSGVLGEYSVSGSGNVAMTTSPVFTTPNIGTATGTASGNWFLTGTSTFTGAVDIVGSSSNTLKHTFNSLGTTQTDGAGLWFTNTTAAAAGAQQRSPSIVQEGQGWKTNATAASQSVKVMTDVLPVQGAANPTASYRWAYSINGGAYTSFMSWAQSGDQLTVPSTLFYNGNLVLRSGSTSGTTIGNATSGVPTNALTLSHTSTSTNTSGTHSMLLIGNTASFAPTSGTAIFNGIRLDNTINQTGGANGAVSMVNMVPTYTSAGGDVYGIRYAPTVTSITGVHYSFSATSGLMALNASVAGSSSFRIPHGTAPSSPVDGDIWTTTAGLYVRINGATVGPLS